MGQIVSFSDARAGKIRAKLGILADRRARGMVETHDGLIDARRIFCRETGAVLIDRYGVQSRVDYGAITDVSPILPAADIVRLARWQVFGEDEAGTQANVLPFPVGATAREGANSE